MKVKLLLTFLLFSAFTSFSSDLINEYSCSNINGPTDAYGNREDWGELFNTTCAAIYLTGFYLSNKSTNLMKWQIPSGSIPANGFKMMYCSNRNTVNGTQLHPNFNLKQTEGDWIILSNTAGVVVDSIKIIHMTKADHSVGRSTNGDRKSTRLNSSHITISYAVFCLKKKTSTQQHKKQNKIKDEKTKQPHPNSNL